MSQFHLRILTGISQFGVAFLPFILLISLFTSSILQYLNGNTFGYLKEIFIRKILGWFLYFFIPFSTGSVSSILSVSKLSSFSIFNSLMKLLKNSLKGQQLLINVPVFEKSYSGVCRITFIWKYRSYCLPKGFYHQISYWCRGIHNVSAFKTQ